VLDLTVTERGGLPHDLVPQLTGVLAGVPSELGLNSADRVVGSVALVVVAVDALLQGADLPGPRLDLVVCVPEREVSPFRFTQHHASTVERSMVLAFGLTGGGALRDELRPSSGKLGEALRHGGRGFTE
jgi:hypothetical protein